MNHPYLYPDQAPWTEEYQDLKRARMHQYGTHLDADHSRYWCDENLNEYEDALYGVV